MWQLLGEIIRLRTLIILEEIRYMSFYKIIDETYLDNIILTE